jgi:hypothetical protein
VHISEPGLKPIGTSGFNHSHIARIIKKSKYSRFVSIEMRRSEPGVREAIQSSVNM